MAKGTHQPDMRLIGSKTETQAPIRFGEFRKWPIKFRFRFSEGKQTRTAACAPAGIRTKHDGHPIETESTSSAVLLSAFDRRCYTIVRKFLVAKKPLLIFSNLANSCLALFEQTLSTDWRTHFFLRSNERLQKRLNQATTCRPSPLVKFETNLEIWNSTFDYLINRLFFSRFDFFIQHSGNIL